MKTPHPPTEPSTAALRAAAVIAENVSFGTGVRPPPEFNREVASIIDHEFSHVPALVEALEGVRSRLLAMPDAPTTSTLLAHDKWRLWTDACNIAREALALVKGQP